MLVTDVLTAGKNPKHIFERDIADPELLSPTTYDHYVGTINRYFVKPVTMANQVFDLGAIALSDVRQLQLAFRAFRAADARGHPAAYRRPTRPSRPPKWGLHHRADAEELPWSGRGPAGDQPNTRRCASRTSTSSGRPWTSSKAGHRGRTRRLGSKGIEAPPKTGERYDLACSFDPTIFQIFERREREPLASGKRDGVFTDSLGEPLDQHGRRRGQHR